MRHGSCIVISAKGFTNIFATAFNIMKLTRITKLLIGTLAFLGMAGAANATLIVQPGPGVIANGASSCTTTCIESVFGVTGISLLYRAYESGWENGNYENSYSTDFSNQDRDAEIDHRSGRSDIDCGLCYLVVRRDDDDGYYFYDLANWNGTENIKWKGPKRIDHVSIWGGGKKVVKVAEPSTLALFGLCLLAVGLSRRRKWS